MSKELRVKSEELREGCALTRFLLLRKEFCNIRGNYYG